MELLSCPVLFVFGNESGVGVRCRSVVCAVKTFGADLYNISLSLYVGDLCGLIIVRLSPYNLLC